MVVLVLFLSFFFLGSDLLRRSLSHPRLPPLLLLWLHVCWHTMSTQVCRLLELMLRSSCCHTIRSRSCLRKAVLAPVGSSGLCAPGVPVLHRRAYSLDSLGSGRPPLGPSSQQPRSERTSPSSALAHRNLSAAAVQVDFMLDTGVFFFMHLSK